MWWGLWVRGQLWEVTESEGQLSVVDFGDVGFNARAEDYEIHPINIKKGDSSSDWWALLIDGDIVKIKHSSNELSAEDFDVPFFTKRDYQVVPVRLLPATFLRHSNQVEEDFPVHGKKDFNYDNFKEFGNRPGIGD